MEPLQIAQRISGHFPEEVLEITDHHGQVSVSVRRGKIAQILRFLKQTEDLQFDHLNDLCGVDYMGRAGDRFEVVYNLYSIKYGHFIRIRAHVPEADCHIQSVTPLWSGANWHERECFDLFGIRFDGHPDMRRVLMPDDWEGHPLRKDYPLKGPGPEAEWKGYKEVLEKSERLKEFGWNR